jgi:hypothetical protein
MVGAGTQSGLKGAPSRNRPTRGGFEPRRRWRRRCTHMEITTTISCSVVDSSTSLSSETSGGLLCSFPWLVHLPGRTIIRIAPDERWGTKQRGEKRWDQSIGVHKIWSRRPKQGVRGIRDSPVRIRIGTHLRVDKLKDTNPDPFWGRIINKHLRGRAP